MKNITIVFFLASFAAFSQNFNQGNEPAIGNQITLHLCDSNANILANTTGNNVTWNFSQIAGIYGVTKTVQLNDATMNPNIASFTGATKVYDIGGTLLTFFSSTANTRTSQGFIFNEPSLGVVTASWNSNSETLMNYPFALGNTSTDNFAGTVNTTATGTIPATGDCMTGVDGSGTLMLPGNHTYTNVLRYHLMDSAIASVFGSSANFIRDVYEYYDFTVGNLPIFLTMTITVNSPLFANSVTLILSKDQPTSFVGLNENSVNAFTVYPNPAENTLQVSGLATDVPYAISNGQGQIVNSGMYAESIDVTNLASGLYFLNIDGQVVTFKK